MGYLGQQPTIGAYHVLDSITLSNGQSAYTMQLDGANFSPQSVNHMLVIINGVPQPASAYSINGHTLTLSSAATTGDVLNEIRVFGDVLNIGTPSDATVTNAKTNFVSTSSAAGLQIKGDGTTDGTLQLNCRVNSHGIKLKSPPHSAGQSYTLTFPSTAPSANKALITDGSGNLSFGSAGGLVKLNTTDITSSTATLSFDNTLITDTYDKYVLSYQGLSPATNSVYLRSRYSTDNGSSFETGTFRNGYHYSQVGTASVAGSGTTASNYATSAYAHTSVINTHASGMYYIDGLRDATLDLHIRHEWMQRTATGGQYYYVSQEGYQYTKSVTMNYIEFSFSSGNIADGTFTLYGLAK